MGVFLFVLVFSMPGPLMPAINTEAMLLFQVLQNGQDPALMIAACSLGQTCTFLLLHRLGEKTVRRVKAFDRRIAALTEEQRRKFANGATAGIAMGSVLGIPPVVVLAPLASSVGYPAWLLGVLALVGRVVRFTVLVMGGETVRAWFGV